MLGIVYTVPDGAFDNTLKFCQELCQVVYAGFQRASSPSPAMLYVRTSFRTAVAGDFGVPRWALQILNKYCTDLSTVMNCKASKSEISLQFS